MILAIDFSSEVPIYLQLRNKIVVGIGGGELEGGEGLPTVRQMAQDLGINTMTVNKAYALLKSEGFITIDRRYGAVVSVSRCPPRDLELYREKLCGELCLVASEAKLKGVGKQEFMRLCEALFDGKTPAQV